MINKVEKIYTVFDRSVAFSEDDILNAVIGYDVEPRLDVLSVDDVISYILNEIDGLAYVPHNVFYVFTNPLTEKRWYINDRIIAVKDKYSYLPEIQLLYSEDYKTALVHDVEDLYTFRRLVCPYNVRITTIGKLSYPNRVNLNYAPATETVRLPFMA